MRLTDATVIVTGGSSGIGRAIARRFAAEGALVVIADIDPDPREGVATRKLPPLQQTTGGVPTADAIAADGGRAGYVICNYAAEGIVCNTVTPGKVLTGKTGQAIAPDVIAYSRAPWPRLGTSQDSAGAVLFLASAEESFIQSATLAVDGGWLAG